MKTYTIEAKMSGTGTIHDIAGDCDRVIEFRGKAKYAVILAAYYGGKGYTTHSTEGLVIKAANTVKDYSYAIIDTDGNRYAIDRDYHGAKLIQIN